MQGCSNVRRELVWTRGKVRPLRNPGPTPLHEGRISSWSHCSPLLQKIRSYYFHIFDLTWANINSFWRQRGWLHFLFLCKIFLKRELVSLYSALLPSVLILSYWASHWCVCQRWRLSADPSQLGARSFYSFLHLEKLYMKLSETFCKEKVPSPFTLEETPLETVINVKFQGFFFTLLKL